MKKRPHNPGVRDLVECKRQGQYRQTQDDGRRGFRGWHERGYLPHFDAPGRTQFVTFRLADSFPASLRSEWSALMEIENDRERLKKLDAYLDLGHGKAWLRRPDIAKIVEDSLMFFHGTRYELRAWVVMPNHVHALFKVAEVAMEEIVESWKSYTANKANKLLNRQGRLWQPGYWDTYMRDSEHEKRTVHYIEANPVKARLVREPKDWFWSSARFRGKFAQLTIPPRPAVFQAAARGPVTDA
ncbi:MAG: transposase [Verrucomicrobia bacterium]|nr:transposase [Verrucomicrobiota bacterium]